MLREDVDSKLIDIFEAIRHEKKWINLSMADKLDFIVGARARFRLHSDKAHPSIDPLIYDSPQFCQRETFAVPH
jgi:hypothetical protein